MNYLERKLDSQLATWANQTPATPLLLTGARRTGKTTTAEHLGQTCFPNKWVKLDFQARLNQANHIFDWETNDIAAIIKRLGEFLSCDLDNSWLLIMDEIQLSEAALNALRFFAEAAENNIAIPHILATGSLLGVTSKERTLPFPSGIKQLELHPLDLEEFLWAQGEVTLSKHIQEHAITGEAFVQHERALELYRRFLVVGGMPKAVKTYRDTASFEAVRDVQAEIDATYTYDMTNTEFNRSGTSARRIWESLPAQLLRASTKKFKYSDVMRGGRRDRLIEPLWWLDAAGIVTINELTRSSRAPLVPYAQEDGSFFKVYVADTGLMFYKFGISPEVFLEPESQSSLSGDFRGALAENFVAQSLVANELRTFYWMPQDRVGKGEIDFVFQDARASVIPVEVKSGRNVTAKTLQTFMENGHASYAIRLSAQNFSKTTNGDVTLLSLPLYAAFCISSNFELGL